MTLTTFLLVASAGCVFLGLAADAWLDSDAVGNALIGLAIIVMIAALFTIEAPSYMHGVDTRDVPREMRD